MGRPPIGRIRSPTPLKPQLALVMLMILGGMLPFWCRGGKYFCLPRRFLFAFPDPSHTKSRVRRSPRRLSFRNSRKNPSAGGFRTISLGIRSLPRPLFSDLLRGYLLAPRTSNLSSSICGYLWPVDDIRRAPGAFCVLVAERAPSVCGPRELICPEAGLRFFLQAYGIRYAEWLSRITLT